MPEVNHVQIGGTTYDLGSEASNLNPGAAIDGVTFTGESNIHHYGVCATASDVAAKVVTITGFALAAGARTEVKFSNANTAANPTLNVSSTGAKPIVMQGSWNAGDVVDFVYDGTNWVATRGVLGASVAFNDGYYPRMVTGAAVNLIGETGTDEEFTTRTTGNSMANGTAMIQKAKGNTLFWNQMIPNGDFSSGTTGWLKNSSISSVTAADGIASATVGNPVISSYIYRRFNAVAGRKYAAFASVYAPRATRARLWMNAAPGNIHDDVLLTAQNWNQLSNVFTAGEYSGNNNFVVTFCEPNEASVNDVYQFKNIMVFDLTAMFGAGNEPTAEEFRSLFPLDYYGTQQTPTPLHYSGTGVQTTGNGWTDTLEIPVSTYFPDGMKSAGGAFDELTAETATARVEETTVGSQTWNYTASYAGNQFYATIGAIATANVAVAGYTKHSGSYATMPDKCFAVNPNNHRVSIRDDAYTSASDFKSEMSAVAILYEASATETTIDPPLNLTYRAEAEGTETSLPINGSVPVTAPFKGVIAYGIDVAGIAASMVNGKMNSFNALDTAKTPDSTTVGRYITTSGSFVDAATPNNWNLYQFSVSSGETYEVTGYAGTAAAVTIPVYAVTTGNGGVLDQWRGSDGGVGTTTITIPDGAAYLYLNTNVLVPECGAKQMLTITDFETAYSMIKGTIKATTVQNDEGPNGRGGVVIDSGDWHIEWGPNGYNFLPNLQTITYQGAIVYTGNTDFIGPYAFTMDNPGSDAGDFTWGGAASMFTTGGGHTFFDDRYTVVNAYIVGDSDTKDSGWLSLEAGGAPLTPETGYNAYFIRSPGDYRGVSYVWNGSNYVLPPHPPTKNEGVRTARCIGIKYFADDKEVPDDELTGVYGCEKFRVVWTNRIQASNTIKWATQSGGEYPDNYSAGLECLEETCWAEFTGGGMINVGVTFKPLVDIHMGWYSGMQAQIHYLYDPDNAATFDADTSKMCYIQQWSDTLMEWARVTNDVTISGVTYPSYAGTDHSVISDVTVVGEYASLDMHMDRDYGVARLSFPDDYSFYTGAGTNWKGYFSIVARHYASPYAMPIGTLWPWRGYYHFRPTDIDRAGLIN